MNGPFDVVVSLDGSGDYISIQDAIDNCPLINEAGYSIYISEGIYSEKIHINKDNIHIMGAGINKTIITAATASGNKLSKNMTYGTYGSRTVYVNAKQLTACDLTICNDFNYIENQSKPIDDPSRINDPQAVALLAGLQADKLVLKRVNLSSFQDTLFLRAGRSVLLDCEIAGNIDFIFGQGQALFLNCEIRARYHAPQTDDWGYLCAPSTDISHPFGLVFKHCRLTKESGVPARSYALGRPWHPTTDFIDGSYADPNAIGQAVFIECEMDDHIYGWDKMHGKDKDGERIYFYPQDSRFFEYKSVGLGASAGGYRPQLSHEQVIDFNDENVLSGWLPDELIGKN